MAGGFVGALSLVPWGPLLEKAPAIYEGASRLVANLRHSREGLDAEAVGDVREGATVQRLATRVEELEQSVLTLNTQLAEAGSLIRELAETNRALARRMLLLRNGVIATAIVSAGALILTIALSL